MIAAVFRLCMKMTRLALQVTGLMLITAGLSSAGSHAWGSIIAGKTPLSPPSVAEMASTACPATPAKSPPPFFCTLSDRGLGSGGLSGSGQVTSVGSTNGAQAIAASPTVENLPTLIVSFFGDYRTTFIEPPSSRIIRPPRWSPLLFIR